MTAAEIEHWRYQFAGQAMQKLSKHPVSGMFLNWQEVAEMAVRQADALLAELEPEAGRLL